MSDVYFAYGTNMSPVHMASRCPGASVVAPAVLRGHRFIFNTHGVGTVVPDPSSDVHGVLWAVEPSDERALDEYEAVAEGLYCKERRTVDVGEGGRQRTVDALIYVATDSRRGVPLVGHLEQILVGAAALNLPERYITELEGWRPG